MSLNDPLANVLSHILIEDRKGKPKIFVRPNSKMIKSVLNIFQEHKYLGDIKETDDGKGGYLEVSLLGAVNKIGVIKPRYSVTMPEYEKFEHRYLPAKGFGLLVVSTDKGLMSHSDAVKNRLGGKLIAFIY